MGFSSQAGHVILKTQATPGTFDPDTGTDGVGIKLRSGSLGSTRELMVPDPEIGGGRDVVDSLLGAGAFSGDYEFYARMDSLLTLLNAALGTTVSATDPDSAVNTHTITPSDSSQLPFLSVEEVIGSSLEAYHYNDCVVNTFHLESDANGYLMGTAGLIGAKQVAGVTPTATADVPWDDGPMTVGTNIFITYGGVSLPAKSFSLDINNNFEDDDFRLGSFYLGDLTPKRREITASFSIRPEDSALWRQAVYGASAATQMGGLTTKQALDITMTTYETITGTTPATNYSLDLAFPKYILKPFAFGPSGDDVIETDVEGQAVRPVAATPIMTATLVNSLAAAA
jgi:hypothetical protein